MFIKRYGFEPKRNPNKIGRTGAYVLCYLDFFIDRKGVNGMESMEKSLGTSCIIPSATNTGELGYFIKGTSLPWVCLKMGDINSLPSIMSILHKRGRRAMLHHDSVKGIAKDKEGMAWLRRIGVDAIITMKSQNLKMIRDNGIITVLGTFLIDSAAVNQAVQSIRSGKPDVVNIMPMTVPGAVYRKIIHEHPCVISGGLGCDHGIIQQSLDFGALACIVTDHQLITGQYVKKPAGNSERD